MTWEGWTEKVHHGSVDWKRHPEDPYENCFSPSVLWCVSLLESSVLKKESYIYLHIYIYINCIPKIPRKYCIDVS